MVNIRERPATIRAAYCGKCQTVELKLKTVTWEHPPYSRFAYMTYEYMCPRCRQFYYLDQEYPRVL